MKNISSIPESEPKPETATLQEVLTLDCDQFRQFLNDCHTSHGFDISRISDLDQYRESEELADLIEKLTSTREQPDSFVNALMKSLSKLAQDTSQSEANRLSQDRDTRTETPSPSPEPGFPRDNGRHEAYCHDALVQAGGRPVVSFARLLQTIEMGQEASTDILRSWLIEADLGKSKVTVPPVFSAQLEDWTTFRGSWQWDNRGQCASDEGFAYFLEAERNMWTHFGEIRFVSASSFESDTRRMWDDQQRHFEVSNKQDFPEYVRAVKKRLTSHHFLQNFELAEDPRRQDAWTTWVEYLNYTYWWQDTHAEIMKAEQPDYQRAWDELIDFDHTNDDEEPPSNKAEWRAARHQICKFVEKTGMYRKYEAYVHRQELRARWILDLLPAMEVASSNQPKKTTHKPGTSGKNKRKTRDNGGAVCDEADSEVDYNRRTVHELKLELKARKISFVGLKLKQHLVRRLQETDRPHSSHKRTKLDGQHDVYRSSTAQPEVGLEVVADPPLRRSGRLRTKRHIE
ncbi:hypothetical protein EJ05DRAFT_485827 [Pseudovirgaria hyperparasitica]|uniref:SAP domain-containing protein n=1 Tax=Pseudovirgaria hyperparasitica TaxID=470096 RepID=A0A6A6W7W3_9PEZI|nr:uncharacterized protein EJ05DRAFT_485827 [Pseudovirgaria hyperparasitica]KAF2758733.1 hypothetical protein EJ05DRAFT_485827 [Pseudovirgaria hyperparasitica]